MKHFLLFLFLTLSLASFAQEPTLKDMLDYKAYAKQNNLTSSDDYIYVLGMLAQTYRDMNDCQNYISNAKEAYDIVKNLRPNTEELANIAGTCAHAYISCNDMESSMYFYKEAYNIYHHLGNHQIEAMLAFVLGSYYLEANKIEDAESYLSISYNNKQYLDIPTLTNLYYALSDIAERQYHYSLAVSYMQMYYDLIKETQGENSYDFYLANGVFGKLLITAEEYKKAEQYLLKDLLLTKERHGENSEEFISTLSDLGLLYHYLSDYTQSEHYYKRALEITKNTLGVNSLHYAAVLLGYANLKIAIGEYTIAEHLLIDNLKIEREHIHEEFADTIVTLQSFGNLYQQMGNFTDAEYYYLQVLNNPLLSEVDKSKIYNSISIVYLNLANNDKALHYQLKGVTTSRELYGEHSPAFAHALHQMGIVYMKTMDFSNSEKCFTQSLAITKDIFGENSSYYSSTLESLALLNEYVALIYGDEDKNQIAYQYRLKVLDIDNNINNGKSINYAIDLNNMGLLCHIMGKDNEAIMYHKKAIDMYKSTCGTNNVSYAQACKNLAVVYDITHKYNEADELFIEASRIDKTNAEQQLFLMSETQREAYWNSIHGYYTSIYPSHSFSAYKYYPQTTILMYDNILFAKGILLNVSSLIQHSIEESNNVNLKNKWNTLQNKRKQITALQSKVTNSDTQHTITILEEECHKIEQEIGRINKDYFNAQLLQKITCQDIGNKLNKHEVAIEFVSFVNYIDHSTDSTMYCALLLRNNSEYPELIPLFEENEALPLINTSNEIFTNRTYGFRIANEDDAIGSDGAIAIGDTIGNGMKLSNLVWSKIMPHIRKGETVYFAPSGLLHQLAIEALPYDETHTMADMFNLVRLSSTREIVLHKDELRHTTATLYGGIQYNMSSDELLAESEQYSTTNLLASRGIENDTLNRGSVRYLPQTKTEVENINRMLKENNLQVQLYTSTNGNEESFKALSGKHQNILHIATHGFFWTDSTAHKKDYFSQRMLMMNDNMPQPPAIDPLNRCGLLFAGANTALQGHSSELPEGVQDGILTAKEISLLDLRDADLVVLSACETGKGEITGEGVFGLQRAFKQAGAQTIIMSLWPVNDAATQLLMTEFYKNWITLHQPKRTAFRNAQKIVRQRYEDPAFWAGFIMLD